MSSTCAFRVLLSLDLSAPNRNMVGLQNLDWRTEPDWRCQSCQRNEASTQKKIRTMQKWQSKSRLALVGIEVRGRSYGYWLFYTTSDLSHHLTVLRIGNSLAKTRRFIGPTGLHGNITSKAYCKCSTGYVWSVGNGKVMLTEFFPLRIRPDVDSSH